MRSTMPDFPLTIGGILRYGTEVAGNGEVVTSTENEPRRRSYPEVGGQAARLANALRRLGVGRDDRVGTFQWNDEEHLVGYLAVPAMGAVLHTLNIRLFPDQLVYIVEHAADKVVIADGSLVPLLARVLPRLAAVETVLVTGDADLAPLEPAGKQLLRFDEVLAAESAEFDWPEVDELDAAAMCYTSGTTGNPKGVVYSHRSSYLHAMAATTGNLTGMSLADRVLPVVPMFHVNAWGMPYAALVAGADLLLPDRFLQAEALVRFIERERPTVSAAVPTIWADVLRHVRTAGGDLSSLRTVIVGGSAAPRSLIEGFDELGVRITHAWGMTETSPMGTVARPPRDAGAREMDLRVTQGRPVCGVEARLVDDAGAVLPHDGRTVGELEVRGPWVTAAYVGGEDPDRFADGWLRTGDVGVIDPLGYLTLTDRSKDLIKSGGEWISSVELENEIMSHPDVLEAAVVGIPDEKWQERPLAAVVLRDGASATPDQLRDHLAGKVARWQLPEHWTLIDAVPKTSVGKFDKKVLRRQYAEGALAVQTLPPTAG